MNRYVHSDSSQGKLFEAVKLDVSAYKHCLSIRDYEGTQKLEILLDQLQQCTLDKEQNFELFHVYRDNDTTYSLVIDIRVKKYHYDDQLCVDYTIKSTHDVYDEGYINFTSYYHLLLRWLFGLEYE